MSSPDSESTSTAHRIVLIVAGISAGGAVLAALIAIIPQVWEEKWNRNTSNLSDFEDRYQEAVKLMGDKSTFNERMLGLEKMEQLIKEYPKADQRRPSLASSIPQWSPRVSCDNSMKQPDNPTKRLLQIVTQARGDDLRLELRDACLRGASIPKARLNNADLAFTDLSGADLYKAQLYQANLRFTDMSGTNLSGANLAHAGLICAKFQESRNLAVPHLMGPKPVSVQLEGAAFHSANIEYSLLTNAKLSGASFNDTVIKNTCMTGANLHGAHFRKVTLESVDLSRTNGSGVLFNRHERDGQEVEGSESVLVDVSFDGADLNSAQFRGAKLERVSFVGADLSGADFEGATISDQELQKGFLCNTKMQSGRDEPGNCPVHKSRQPISKSPDCESLVKAHCAKLKGL